MGIVLWADASACAVFFEVGSADERAGFDRRVDAVPALAAVPDPSPGADETFIERDLHGRVALFVDSLPDRLRDIAYRHYWLGETQSAIAADLGVSRSAVCHAVAKISRLGRSFFGISKN